MQRKQGLCQTAKVLISEFRNYVIAKLFEMLLIFDNSLWISEFSNYVIAKFLLESYNNNNKGTGGISNGGLLW